MNKAEYRVMEDSRIAKQIEELHHRVFDGLGKELREELSKEIGKVTKLVISILIAVLLALAGIVIEGRFSALQASEENNRNYKAIIDIGSRLESHIEKTE